MVDGLGVVVQAARKINGSSAEPSRVQGKRLMQNTRDTQHELWNFNLERCAVLILHLVTAAHRADLCGQHCAAGIFETLARFEQGLLTDYTLPAHFLHMVMGIGDNPMAADELDGRMAEIGNGDGVRKHVTMVRLVGLLRQVIYLRLYDNTMLIDFLHAQHLNRFLLMSQGFRSVLC